MSSPTAIRNAMIKSFKNAGFLLNNTIGMEMPLLIVQIANEKNE
ncbi:hypothetical protein MY9_2030 [Bacillus sp. JS]|nr:hypothetical protein MY9_2030 [Bacillus sp. JS]